MRCAYVRMYAQCIYACIYLLVCVCKMYVRTYISMLYLHVCVYFIPIHKGDGKENKYAYIHMYMFCM